MFFSRRHRLRQLSGSALALSCTLLALCLPRVAHAQSTIKDPGQRPRDAFELEPHLIATPFEPPNDRSDGGYGLGLRATIEVLPDGLIPKLNDSVGIGFGLDWVHYELLAYRGGCRRFEYTAQNVPVCVDAGGGSASYLYVPAVMQWNFWLHPRWSAFGEGGLAIAYRNGGGLSGAPDFSVGGRYHATDAIALTLRLGFPATSLGVSFLF